MKSRSNNLSQIICESVLVGFGGGFLLIDMFKFFSNKNLEIKPSLYDQYLLEKSKKISESYKSSNYYKPKIYEPYKPKSNFYFH